MFSTPRGSANLAETPQILSGNNFPCRNAGPGTLCDASPIGPDVRKNTSPARRMIFAASGPIMVIGVPESR